MKRFLLVIALCVAYGCSASKLDQQKFEQVHRAARDVREHAAGGIAVMAYRDLVGKYGTEVSLARDKASSELENEFIAHHTRALGAYRDALAIWNLKLTGREFSHIGDVPYQHVVDEYSVPGTGAGTDFVFKIDDAIQVMWKRADGALDNADALYRGDPAP